MNTRGPLATDEPVRETGRAFDATQPYEPYFSDDPESWPQAFQREVPVAVQTLVEAHRLATKYRGHPGIFECDCVVAKASGLSKHAGDGE